MATAIEHPDQDLHAPELLDIEVTSTLRGLWLAGELDDVRAQEALDHLRDLPLVRHHRDLTHAVFALRRNISACAACYVALAELVDATLVSLDAPLRRAVAGLDLVPVAPDRIPGT